MPMDPLNQTELLALWWMWSVAALIWWVLVALHLTGAM
jgi:hypothetical protein